MKPTDMPPHEPGSPDPRYRPIERAMARHAYRPDALVEVLHAAMSALGSLDDDLLAYVSRTLGLPPSRVYGVATFYHAFSLSPKGAHECVACLGTVCHVKRGDAIVTALEDAFGVRAGGTTADGKLTLSVARCLGNCSMAPMALVDGGTVANTDPAGTIARVRASLGEPAE